MPQSRADFQSEKAVIRAHYAALAGATPDTVAACLAQNMHADGLWRGMHPFHLQTGPQAVAETFWSPLLRALTHMQRREDLFFAGENEIDGFSSVWTASMGHLVGLFDAPFLGIPPTGKMAFLRYAEFNKVEDGKIIETALFVDLLHLMVQANCYPLPPQTAVHLVQPGPMTHDGVQLTAQDPAEGPITLTLINDMIGEIARNRNKNVSAADELRKHWQDDMIWWGPAGIGSTYTVERYIKQHQKPFRENLVDYRFNGHLCRMAEGKFGGFFGWANLSMRNAGSYMGMPGGAVTEMRVVDFYRRGDDKLAENWVFIDMLHYLNLQGYDVLARLQDTLPPRY